jgi:protein CpxP
MSLTKKLFIGFAAFIAAGTFAVAGSAQTTEEKSVEKTEKHERRGMRREGFGKGEHGGKFGRGMRGLRGIELSEEQKTAIKAIHDANRPDEATRAEMKTIMQARREGTITPEQTERAKQLRAQVREKAEGIHLQIQNILTPEQRQQIETKKAEMKQRREEMRQQRELRRQQATPKTDTEKPID